MGECPDNFKGFYIKKCKKIDFNVTSIAYQDRFAFYQQTRLR